MVGDVYPSHYIAFLTGEDADLKACASFCTKSPSQAQLPYLNELAWISYLGMCYCYFDDPVFNDPDTGSDSFLPNGAAFNLPTENSDVDGEIDGTNGAEGFWCYKNNIRLF